MIVLQITNGNVLSQKSSSIAYYEHLPFIIIEHFICSFSQILLKFCHKITNSNTVILK